MTGTGSTYTVPPPTVADPDGVAEGRYGPGVDPAEHSAKYVDKARTILGRYAGYLAPIPPADVIDHVVELLHHAVNPDGITGQAQDSLAVDYPTKWLPSPMQAQLAARGSLSAGGVGAALLGCGSAACMASRLIIDDTRRVAPTLWVPSIGDAGSGKTPAADLAWDPYHHREDVEAQRYAAEMTNWTTLDRKERDQTPKPFNNTKLTQDCTVEALARRLHGGGECIAVATDELVSFLQGVGQYKKTGGGALAERGRFLSLWSGKPWTYERVGNSADGGLFIHISNPVLPVFGTIQPEFVQLLGDIGSGMQSRWLPHWCAGRQGTETGRTAHDWEAALRVLLNDLHRPRTWTMTRDSEARREHLAAEERWAVEASDLEQTAASTSFLAKGGEHSARIALVLAEVDAAADAAACGYSRVTSGPIPVWAVRAAVDLVDYCAAVWRMLPNVEAPLSRSWAEARIAEKDGQLNAWLRNHGGSATKRSIQRARVAGARTPAEVQALIDRHTAIYGEDAAIVESRGQLVVYAR